MSAARRGAPALPLVLVSVGSDFHPFSRLVRWADDWMADGGSAGARCTIQYGTAAAPRIADGAAFLDHDTLLSLMREATVTVTQGGPSTMIEARRHGHLPIVVPRSKALGEHVDDHQHAFCAQMASQGQIALATDEATFRRSVEEALREPERYLVDPQSDGDRLEATVGRFAGIAQRLAAEHDAAAARGRRLPFPRPRSGHASPARS